MKKILIPLVLVLSCMPFTGWAQQMTDTNLSCEDFRPTQDALRRFPDLIGACEAVVEQNGELYGRFSAVVRRATNSSVTLYLPATDHTFRIDPKSDARVLIGRQKIRSRDLQRGQEIQIHISARQFSRPNIEDVALISEEDMIINHPVARVAALPTTASPWPAIALLSLALLGTGVISRYGIRSHRSPKS